MARPKKHLFPIPYEQFVGTQAGSLPLDLRAAYIELAWWLHRNSPSLLPTDDRILAHIVRVSVAEFRRLWLHLAPMFGLQHDAFSSISLATNRASNRCELYVAQVGPLLKIGIATSAAQRRHQGLAFTSRHTVTPLAVLPHLDRNTAQILERAFQWQFRAHLVKGREWFADVEPIRTWAATLHALSGQFSTGTTNEQPAKNEELADESRELSTGEPGNLCMDSGYLEPVEDPGTLPGTNPVSTYVPVLVHQKSESSADASPSSRFPDLNRFSDRQIARLAAQEAPGAMTAFTPPLGPLPGTSDAQQAAWLVERALEQAGGSLRGDHLRRAVFELSAALPTHIKSSAVPMAWSQLFWRSLPQIDLSDTPDQPPTADPGHPELLVTLRRPR